MPQYPKLDQKTFDYLPEPFKQAIIADKPNCPFCGRPSIDRCGLRDWAWYPCDWEKQLKTQQQDNN